MAEFAWTAKAQSGELQKGVMVAADKAAVERRLRQQQLAPEKIARRIRLSFGAAVSVPDLVRFIRQFATMIDAGLPLVQCLDILANQEPNPALKAALADIKSTVEQGATFSDALRRHPKIFDELFVNLVHAGEVGGILDTILTRLAVYLEKRAKLMRQVKGALTYPTIVIIIMAGVMTVLLTWVIPAFEGMFAEFGAKDALPSITKFVIAMSRGFVSYLPIIFVVVAGSVTALVWSIRRPAGKKVLHNLLLRIPVMGPVMQKIAVARFSRTLSTLLSSGVPILDALEIVAKSAGNVVVEAGLMHTRARVAEGRNIAEPLAEVKVFPGMVVQMVSVGEQTGALDQMLSKIADFYEEETDVAVASLTSMLEPIL
ncbi:MAG: type II secretion system F family protein, partial [Myxococcales bacterium]|nr:type II secretion system F family protein [Myxococcales bacterium]